MRRYVIGGVWALGVLLPDLLARGLRSDVTGSVLYLVAAAASLLLWMTTIEALGRLRASRPRLAWAVIALLALFVPLWVAATARYYATLHQDFPPSAVCFFLRNPRYGYTLAVETTTLWHRLLIPGGVIGAGLLLHALTRRPLGASEPWLRNTRWAGLAVVAVLMALPKAARSADLEGMRSTLGGVALWITSKPHLDKPARFRPSPLPAAAQRPNIVILLQESLGASQWSPWNGKPGSSPRIEEMLTGDADLARWFPHATTAAGATAVSLPTILTGVDPDAPGEAFVHAPLLWQEARVLGYRTALFSAEDYDWMNFRSYFLGKEGPDESMVAAEFGLTVGRVNDNGVDDMITAEAATRYIDRVPLGQPFLLIVQFNATHRPCYAPGVEIEGLDQRCAAAAAYVDAAAGRVIDHLRKSGRIENTLLVGTADHGETFRTDRPPRLESYYEDVMRVPLYLRLPLSYAFLNPGALAQLQVNTRERVNNIDLYPTILDVWGRWPLTGHERPALHGQSLLRPLDPRRTLVAVNTGEIHDFNWSNEGFALYHHNWKWLCDEYHGAQLFDLTADPGESVSKVSTAPPAELAHFRLEIARRPNLRRILSKVSPDLL